MGTSVDLLEVHVFGGDFSNLGRILKLPTLEVVYGDEKNVSSENSGTSIRPYFNAKWYFQVSSSISKTVTIKISEGHKTDEVIAEQEILISPSFNLPKSIELSTLDNKKIFLTLSINHIHHLNQYHELLKEPKKYKYTFECKLQLVIVCTIIVAISVFISKQKAVQLENSSFKLFQVQNKVEEPLTNSKNPQIVTFIHAQTIGETSIPKKEEEIVYSENFDEETFKNQFPWKLEHSIISDQQARSLPFSLHIKGEVELEISIPMSVISFWVKPDTCGASTLKILYHHGEKWVKVADHVIFGKEFREKVHVIPSYADSLLFQVEGQCGAYLDDLKIEAKK